MGKPLLLTSRRAEYNETVGKPATVLYVLAMVAIIVGVDVVFLRHLFWPRLLTNIGIVLVFIVVYLVFLKRS